MGLYVLKTEPTRFSDGLDERHEQNKRVKMTQSFKHAQPKVDVLTMPRPCAMPVHGWME